ncbi:unnamed protein product [Amoebophrya sp. A25]|nr:unnamed protein product [Amoebophrya sp. A25]|eukprot:GSA25T00003969001.1
MEDSDSDEAEDVAPQEDGLPALEDPDFAQFVSYLGCAEIVNAGVADSGGKGGAENLQSMEHLGRVLLRVVQEAYVAPLPPNWSEFSDPEGRIYFYNYATEQSSWAHPSDKTYRELIQIVKKVKSVVSPLPREEVSRIIDVHLQSVHQRAMEAIAGFSGPYVSEDGGHEYYYNEITNVSTWESPVVEWEHNISTRYHVLYRCLLEPYDRLEEEQEAGKGASASSSSVSRVPPRLQLPLHLVGGGGDSAAQLDVASLGLKGGGLAPPTPSTTRSYHTARSQGSARTGRRSGRDSSGSFNDGGNSTRSGKSPSCSKHRKGQPRPPDPDDESDDEEPFNFTFGSGAIVSKS